MFVHLYILVSILICCCSWKFPRFAPTKLISVHKQPKTLFGLQRKFIVPNRCVSQSIDVNPVESENLPLHPELVEGRLTNGLMYRILPNSIPSGRFEAHLEVLSGSIKELEHQQGMAHLLEHVAYMGSPKRQLISGTGSRTNAYTDFHHTVFFAACPNTTPDQFWKKPMLPMAFDALVDVMTTPIDSNRLEKERAAVLSEASMVNKMDYRIECEILSCLHSENRLPKRFPIGKESQIKSWQREDLQLYHDLHYRPDNVILYIVGDIDIANTVALINEKFGHLRPRVDADKILSESKEFAPFSMQNISRHFPPLIHHWSIHKQSVNDSELPAISSVQAPVMKENVIVTTVDSSAEAVSADNDQQLIRDLLLPNTRVFKHDLLQTFSFHLFAKRPIEPLTTKESLKRDLMKRMILNALQIRLNIFQRSSPVFTLADFQQINWIREGCAVCSLDITTDLLRYEEAIRIAITEIKRLGQYGLTPSEFLRYKTSIAAEAQHDVGQSATKTSELVLTDLMENTANGHVVMHPFQRFEIVDHLLATMTLDEVNAVAKDVCEHISHIDPKESVVPRAIVTCIPSQSREGESCNITEKEILQVVLEALKTPVQPLHDTPVPSTLLTADYMREQLSARPPTWSRLAVLDDRKPPAHGEEAKNDARSVSLPIDADVLVGSKEDIASTTQQKIAIAQKQLGNGLKVNLISNPQEPERLHVRLFIPGGRLLEDKQSPGSVLLAARTIQEGGAFLNMTREEVELFCIDHRVMVEINANTDHLTIDLASTTSSSELSEGKNDKNTPGITGSEAVYQVAHILLTSFKFEDDAFLRAKLGQQEAFDGMIKGLETSCMEALSYSLTNGDHRFLSPNHQQIDSLSMKQVVNTILPVLQPHCIEMTVSGDLPMDHLEALTLAYLGTVPAGVRNISLANSTASDSVAIHHPPPDQTSLRQTVKLKTLGKSQQLGIFLPDSEERAIGYLAGPSPNSWGITEKGESLAEAIAKLPLITQTESDIARRSHPLFGYLALAIVQEVANRRLFSVVREERQLTYDASFQFEANDLLTGGSWFYVTVTSSPQKIQSAIGACKEALHSLLGPFGVSGESVSSSKRSLLQKWMNDKVSHKHWIDLLTGSQFPSLFPTKKDLPSLVKDYADLLSEITVQDIQLVVKLLGFDEEQMTVCVGVASPQCPPGMTAPKEYDHKPHPAADSPPPRSTSATALS